MSRHPITAAIVFLLTGLVVSTGRAEILPLAPNNPAIGTDTGGLVTEFGTSTGAYLYPSAMPLLENGTIVPGNGDPFGAAGTSLAAAADEQQVYEARGFASPLTIDALRFRPASGASLPPGFTYASVTVTLSVTPLGEDQLSTNLPTNVGSGATTVFAGPLTPSLTGSDPAGFNFVVPFTTPYSYDPAAGNLLTEINVATYPAAAVGTLWSTQVAFGDGTSRAFHLTPGLPASVPAPPSAFLLAIGLGLFVTASGCRSLHPE